MTNNNDHRSCVPENVVAYIYSEMDSAEIPAFEKHLAECSSCADEFAEISDARFSVFEWRRDEFDALETPVFEIPYEKPQKVEEPVGWLTAILANLRWIGGAVTAFAALAVVAALGFYYFNSGPANDNLASQNNQQTIIDENKREIVENTKQTPSPVQPAPDHTTIAKFKSSTPKRQAIAIPVVAKTRRIVGSDNLYTAANPKHKNVKTGRRDLLPTLNNFEDNDDDSLRLAELLADVDAKNDN